MSRESLSRAQWFADGTALFGPDPMNWKFVCPVCKHVATARDWKDAGAPEGAVAFSCVGRWLPKSEEGIRRQDEPEGAVRLRRRRAVQAKPRARGRGRQDPRGIRFRGGRPCLNRYRATAN